MTDLSKLTDAEINASVAVEVMGWVKNGDWWLTQTGSAGFQWSPATDHNDCATMRAKIERLGLENVFATELCDLSKRYHANSSASYWWHLVNASPRQQCEAALTTVRSSK